MTLEIEPDEYRLDPPDIEPPHPHFEVHDLRHNTIEGNGATFVFTDPSRGGIHVLGGEGLTVRALTLDWDPVPFTQVTITGLTDGGRTVAVTVDEGYPAPTHAMFDVAQHVSATLHAPDGRLISGIRQRGSPFKEFSSVTELGGRRYELVLADRPGQNTRGLAVGRRLVLAARGGHGVAHGIWFTNADALTLESLTVHTSPGMAIQGSFCSDARVIDATISPPPDSDRDLGSVADGINFSNGAAGPTIEGCRLERIGDDGVIVDTELMAVADIVDDRTIGVASVGRPHAERGDVFEVMTPGGVRKGGLPPVADLTHRTRHDQPWVPDVPETLTFEGPIEGTVQAGDYLANRAEANAGFRIRDTVVRGSVANSIRLGSGPGVVEGNTLDGAARHGIWLRCDTSGTHAPKRWTNDVVIRNNRIAGSGLSFFAAPNASAIRAVHRLGEAGRTEGRPHRNLVLEGNLIEDCAHLGVELEDVEGAQLLDHELRALNRLVYRAGGGFGVGLTNVADVAVTGNRLSGPAEALYQLGWQAESEGVTASENRLRIGGAAVQPAIVEWRPVVLAFDRTMHPEGSDRHIAYRCEALTLLADGGEPIVAVEMGGREMPVEFGEGVYSVDSGPDGPRRWFGGRDGRAQIYVADVDLQRATRLELRGRPVVEGMGVAVVVDGRTTDRLEFDAERSGVHELSLVP